MQKKILAGFDGIIELHAPVVESVHLLRVQSEKGGKIVKSFVMFYYCFFLIILLVEPKQTFLWVCAKHSTFLFYSPFFRDNQGVGSDDP